MCRVVKNGGRARIFNINYEYMKDVWIYRYYPQLEHIDRERFPAAADLYCWMEEAGFETRAVVRTEIKRFYYADMLEEVRNRDMSQLTLISDTEYEAGLAKLEADSAEREYLVADIAFADFVGIKK